MMNELVAQLIREAIGPEFEFEHDPIKRWGWVSVVNVAEPDIKWGPAQINVPCHQTSVHVSYGYSSRYEEEVNVADPEFGPKIRALVQKGWDLCPDFEYYTRK